MADQIVSNLPEPGPATCYSCFEWGCYDDGGVRSPSRNCRRSGCQRTGLTMSRDGLRQWPTPCTRCSWFCPTMRLRCRRPTAVWRMVALRRPEVQRP